MKEKYLHDEGEKWKRKNERKKERNKKREKVAQNFPSSYPIMLFFRQQKSCHYLDEDDAAIRQIKKTPARKTWWKMRICLAASPFINVEKLQLFVQITTERDGNENMQ